MRLLTTHWTLDSRESRPEREYITIVISIVDTNFPQAPACLFSSFDTHTTTHKESEQALRKSLWVAQVCSCFGLRWTFDSTYFAFNKLLPSIKLASALLRISKTDAHKDCIWTLRCDSILPLAHSSRDSSALSYHDRHLATAGLVTAQGPGSAWLCHYTRHSSASVASVDCQQRKNNHLKLGLLKLLWIHILL